MIHTCNICDSDTGAQSGAPYLIFKDKVFCSNCYISLIEPIYKMAGVGDGGLIHLSFSMLLRSRHNKKKRLSIPNYSKTLNLLLDKYNFKCVLCEAKDKLTIDHIVPVSKGGGDEVSNLQILCKSCNSKKGAKDWEDMQNVK